MFLLLGLGITNYFIGKYSKRYDFLYYVGLLINIGCLAFYKYVDNLTMPLGISFYTFNSLMYLIDVKNNKVIPEENIFCFLAFIMMFPTISMGPLNSYRSFQYVFEDLSVDFDQVVKGIKRFIFGLAVKCIIGDNLAILYKNMYGLINASIMSNIICIFVYGLYLYIDFASYSDMAIGIGKMIGLDIQENFDYPYCATTISDFWRRWHMSLTNFFTKYVYIPLGGNKVKFLRHVFNILIVWALTGLWHGSSINFILWGLYYGVILIIEKYLLQTLLAEAHDSLKHIYVLVIVMIGYVFFINNDINEIKLFFMNIKNSTFIDHNTLFYIKENLVLIIIAIVLCIKPNPDFNYAIKHDKKASTIYDIVLIVLFILSLIYILSGNYSPFLYSNF